MRPSDFLCARGLHPVAPAAPCASCAARNTAPARWATSAPVRAPGAFVVAPRVPAAAPRRLPPLPPLPASHYEALAKPVRTSPCTTPGCEGIVHEHRQGPPPAPGTETVCEGCRRHAQWQRADARRRGTPEESRSHGNAPAVQAQRAAAYDAAVALVAHYGNERRACDAAGVSKIAIFNLRHGRAGAYVCGRLVEAAAKITRAA